MSWITKDTQIIKGYLLGVISEEKLQQVEEQLLVDDEYYEEVKSIEDELIENYVSGRLENKERIAFEQHFMRSPEQQARVKSTRLLRNHFLEQIGNSTENKASKQADQTSRGWLNWSFLLINSGKQAFTGVAVLSVIILAVALGSLLWNRNWSEQWRPSGNHLDEQAGVEQKAAQGQTQLQNKEEGAKQELEEIARRQQENQEKDDVASLKDQSISSKEQRSSSDKKLAQVKKGSKPINQKVPKNEIVKSEVVTYELAAGQMMSAGANNRNLRLGPETKNVRLKLEVEADGYQNYQAEVSSEEDKVLWEGKKLVSQGSKGKQEIIITLPAKILSESNYKIVLTGTTGEASTERVGTYYFRVIRK